MMKRILSVLLVLVMVLGMIPTFAQAAEGDDVVYVDESTSMEELVEQGIVQTDVPVEQLTQSSSEETDAEPEANSPVINREPQVVQAPTATICDCGRLAENIHTHSDGCALRQYYYDICGGASDLIYELWRGSDAETRVFLEGYLSNKYPEKLEEVKALQKAEAESEVVSSDFYVRLEGEASATVEDVTVDALGVPEGSSLTVQEPSAEVKEIVEELAAEGEAKDQNPEQVFFYDISVQNEESDDWQPEGTSVQMSISIPGLKLHKYAEVVIFHVDDEGNITEIYGNPDENGSIVFETGGFSTFAGFTVDFHYGSAMVSIPGETSITMSELFDRMQMPLYASDVVDVQFTDYSLLTVTQLEGDWLLTSLIAFDTNEKLTFTMKDGNVYEFEVTDATINGDTDDNNTTRWFANNSGGLAEGSDVTNGFSQYWSNTNEVVINGSGSFRIALVPTPWSSLLPYTNTAAYVSIYQIKVTGGAHLKVDVSSHFEHPEDGKLSTYEGTAWSKMANVIMFPSGARNKSLFLVENGSLELLGYQSDKQDIDLALRGAATSTTYIEQPIVVLGENCTSFKADNVEFYNAKWGAVFCKSTSMTSFEMNNCEIRDLSRIETTENKTYNGAGINLSYDNGQSNFYQVQDFKVTNCTFKNLKASSYGGGIFLGDRINKVTITGCTFNDCEAYAGGGAIAIRAACGKVDIDADFTDCTARKNGGGILVESIAVKQSTQTTRIHTLNLSGCNFTRCKATGTSSNSGDRGAGGGANIAAQIENVNITNCVFDACASMAYTNTDLTNFAGGGLIFSYSALGNKGTANAPGTPVRPFTDALTWKEGSTTKGSDPRSVTYGWTTSSGAVEQRTTIGTVTISGCTFKNTTTCYQGGGFMVRTGACIEDLNVSSTNFLNCQSTISGSAIFFNDCIVDTADFTNCTFKSNKIQKALSTGGGTVRTAGKATSVMTFDNCEFWGNEGVVAGGGIYWNAGNIRTTPAGTSVKPEATVKNCEFYRNTALPVSGTSDTQNHFGGAIFTETKMTIQNCLFEGNEAEKGGAINLGVYNADYRMFSDGEVTELALDSNTEIRYNTANKGGGIAIRANKTASLKDNETLAHSVKFTLGGAEIHHNVAKEYGGGIFYEAETYDNDAAGTAEVQRYTKTINIDNGTIRRNYAWVNGGGIYMASSENSTIIISNGTIYGNEAGIKNEATFTETKDSNGYLTAVTAGHKVGSVSGGDGGAIYLTGKNAVVTISGGTIGSQESRANIAHRKTTSDMASGRGGGLAITGGSSINMTLAEGGTTGGEISWNQAGFQGGGIWLANDATNPNSITISGGTIKNNKVTATEANSANGGGIYVGEKGSLTMSGGEVSGCSTIAWGGGIYINGGGSVTVSNSAVIKGNSASVGGGICYQSGGTGSFTGGEISGNTASNNGGGLVARVGTEVTVDGVTVKDNTATNNAGGIYLDNSSTVEVKSGYVQNNTATNASGGGIYSTNSTVKVQGGEISGNTAGTSGGGIFSSGSTVTIQGGEISGNTATTAGGGVAGHSSSYVSISNGDVKNNKSSMGGGISINGSTGDDSNSDETKRYGLYFNGGTVSGNMVVPNADGLAYGGGICVSGTSDAKINNGTISGNRAAADFETETTYAANQEGGGVAVCQGSTLTITGGLIKENHAYDGGGIEIRGNSSATMTGTLKLNSDDTVDLSKSTGIIMDNVAHRRGGGVDVNGSGDKVSSDGSTEDSFTMDGGYIYSNDSLGSSTDMGGGGVASLWSAVTLNNGRIESNTAGYYGGGIYGYTSDIIVNDGVLKSNTTDRHGGAITCRFGDLTITTGRFEGNSADNKGGAIYVYGNSSFKTDVTISGGTFKNNTAEVDGGALCSLNGQSVSITGGTFEDNTATTGGGGAMFLNNVTDVDIKPSSASTEIIFKINDAKTYGGAVYAETVTSLEITGGTFESNTVISNDGGAVYAKSVETVTISGGTFTGNIAPKNGGGAYFDTTDVTFTTGEFDGNIAKNGGGLYIVDAEVDFTGGTFKNHIADRGGALFIRSSEVTIDTITVQDNHAKTDDRYAVPEYFRGGGLCIDTYGSGPATVTINGGTFTGNTAKDGGGIWVNNNAEDDNKANIATLTITGGDILGNTASRNGGGIWIGGDGYVNGDTYTSLTLNGGKIGGLVDGKEKGNIATGNGGGIYAEKLARVFINGTTQRHGEISYNAGKNGGGVYVVSGANLTVNNGHITHNSAVAPANAATLGSGHHTKTEASKLYGAGGGVCVVEGSVVENSDGSTTTFRSSFTLTGTDVAIYGNQAAFAGDDVFSNGNNTQLNVPEVTQMNLVGYDFNPEGWVEDYATYDSAYAQYGTYMIGVYASASGLTDEAAAAIRNTPVLRYRNAMAAERRYMLIKPEYVSGKDANEVAVSGVYANKADAYVAMTLGIPGAMEDVVVIDYGSKVTISAMENDLFMNESDFANTDDGKQHSYIGKVMPPGLTEKDGIYYSRTKPSTGSDYGIYGTYFSSDRHGKLTNLKNGSMTFELLDMHMDDADSFFYMVQHNEYWYFANLTVVPATTLYYEDNATYVTDNGTVKDFIKYHKQSDSAKVDVLGENGTPVTGADGKVIQERIDRLATWATLSDESTAADSQNQDRPGAAIMGGIDADNLYGYDSNYATSIRYSNGSVSKVQVGKHTLVDSNNDNLCDTCQRRATHSFVGSGTLCGLCYNPKENHNCTDAHTCADTKYYNGYCNTCSKHISHTVNARATFTFTGTGFDIISLCNTKTAVVTVSVWKLTDEIGTEDIVLEDNPYTPEYEITNPATTYMVDSWYQAGSLYQVPLIKVDMNEAKVYNQNWEWTGDYYGYGTYMVEIYVAPGWDPANGNFNECEFYLDAIRVYNPVGSGGEKNESAYDAYFADNECWPVYAELRNMFIDSAAVTNDPASGKILFIDKVQDTVTGVNKVPTVSDYQTWGPNNEVYLAPEQSVAFTLDASKYDANLAAVHLAMRGATGQADVLVQYKEGNTVTNLINTKDGKAQKLSATDMYYDITPAMGKTLVITNNGTGIVALSTLKVTHSSAPVSYGNAGGVVYSDENTSRGALEILTAEQLAAPTVTPKYPALSFNGMVCYNVFFSAEDLGDLTADDLGLAVFNTYAPEGTVANANEVHLGATQIDGLYMIATDGVNAKYLGDTKYFRTFVKCADGSYIYSKMVSYSAKDYAMNVLERSDDVKLKQLVVAMLNYGAEAQKFFGYKTYDLMNKDLTADDQALLAGYSADSLKTMVKADDSKIGVFANNGGFAARRPAISFNGAFEINYFMTPANAVDGDMTMYFWSEDTYNAVTELTAENADKAVVMTLENGTYTACSDEIFARRLDETVYAAAVYESDGVTYCTGVLAYSIAAYCQKPPAGVQDLATAAAIYGCAAKEFFGA